MAVVVAVEVVAMEWRQLRWRQRLCAVFCAERQMRTSVRVKRLRRRNSVPMF